MSENREPVVHLDRSFWWVTAILAVLSILSILAWLAAPISSWLPEAVDKAKQIDELFRFLAASGTVLFIFICGYLLYFSIAFRRRSTDAPDAIGVQIHDNHKLEFWWTVVPAVFVVIMAFVSVKIWYGIQVAPNNGIVVEALAHQWNYTFRYPEIHGEIPDQMHLQVGVPVTLHVTSYDVIHSFWVPSMRLKADMVPGIINTIRFTPTNVGTYPLLCTEFCGTLHGKMAEGYNGNVRTLVVIDPPDKYKRWYDSWQRKNAKVSDAVAAQGSGAVALAGGDAKAGQTVFAQKCSACHALGPYGQKLVGPGLKGILHDPAHPNLVDGDKATPENVAKIIQTGYRGDMGQMPNMQANQLSAKDIANLVAFLSALK